MPKQIDIVFERNPPPWRAGCEDPGDDFHTFTVRDARDEVVCWVKLRAHRNVDDAVVRRLMDAIWFYAQEDGIDRPLEPWSDDGLDAE